MFDVISIKKINYFTSIILRKSTQNKNVYKGMRIYIKEKHISLGHIKGFRRYDHERNTEGFGDKA